MSSQTNDHRPVGEQARRSLTKDDAYHLLQNSRRRALLRYLFAHEGETFWLQDVANEIAAWECDTTVDGLDSDERQRVYVALYQSHLPKLDDHGIVDYESSIGRIRVLPLADSLEPLVGDELAAAESIHVGERDQAARRPGGLLDQLLPR